jgi:hypothetical protein
MDLILKVRVGSCNDFSLTRTLLPSHSLFICPHFDIPIDPSIYFALFLFPSVFFLTG